MVLTSTDGASLFGHQVAVALSFSFTCKAATSVLPAATWATHQQRIKTRPSAHPTCCSSPTDTSSPCRIAPARPRARPQLARVQLLRQTRLSNGTRLSNEGSNRQPEVNSPHRLAAPLASPGAKPGAGARVVKRVGPPAVRRRGGPAFSAVAHCARPAAGSTHTSRSSGAVGDLTDGPAHSGPPIATAKLQTLTNLFITVWMAVVPAMGSELRCVGTKRPILGPNRPKMWVKSLMAL